jgi:hypothetical protein
LSSAWTRIGPIIVWLSTPFSPAAAWYPTNATISGRDWIPSIIEYVLCFPVIIRIRGSSCSSSRLRIGPCASVTSTSSTPPSNNPSATALTSDVHIG